MPHTTAEPRALSRLRELSTRLLHSHWAMAAASGFRSIVATPLFGRSNESLGAICAHVRRPPRHAQRELRYADLYSARLRT